ncbi:alpha/beta hydrolase family protein [Lutibacter holmesii]|uniref:Alpha/beta hydrolase family protein n=1 Tax=Lutibacter holmesii TaxID=1137985 RepID=A0ABW3WNG9_9FLAO
MKAQLTSLFILLSVATFAQKKVLDHKDFEIWNSIKNKQISANGKYVMYSLEKGEKDNFLQIKDAKATTIFQQERAQKGIFTSNSKFALFTIKPWKDSVVALKRKKIKKDKLPKDSLGIYNLNSQTLTKIGNVKSYKVPEEWSGYVAYLLEDIKKEKDTSKKKSDKKKSKKKLKKVGKENGYHLVLRNLNTNKQDTIKFVKDYLFAKEGAYFTYTTTGLDSTLIEGVYVVDLKENTSKNIYTSKKAKYHQLSISDTGKNIGFVVDADTTKVQVRPNELYVWSEGKPLAEKILDAKSSPKGYRVSSDGKIHFSKDASKMYFGLATPPIVKDTTLIDEEIVNVEVWTYNEPRLYTVQELQVKDDQKKSYETVLHLNNNSIVQLATKEYPNANIGNEGNAAYSLVRNSEPYQLESQWKGYTASDYALVNVATGETTEILNNIAGRVRLSPAGKYAYGYNSVDSTWFAYSVATNKLVNLTAETSFYDELNDSPKHPRSYGAAGWTTNDDAFLIYDRYDIWKFNPENGTAVKLTNGRASKITYKYLKLNDEERFIPKDEKWLLSTFNGVTMDAGYYEYNSKNNKGKQLIKGPNRFTKPLKAKNTNNIVFTKESFTQFPDLIYSDLSFKSEKILTNANPQQSEYNWGTAELVHWTSLDGIELTGMLIKPENFDASKKYPMIVNFYERSSDRLHRHIAPSPGRSTINYSFYASRGYVIFNPDVVYKVGYPGESAYNCVIPGVNALIEKGFVDKDNIGVQGHSWGGYQIAHLVTKTNIFKAAESGAPVANMISAYGGIRWWTGLSRQFQYEHTQSRIGGTPWEVADRYIENSPIFNIDKITTPLLIMHNDADGHVPWYQGIEFFVSLRRLGKPSWFLNYNEEPHWPLKMQNRKDFNIRMAQFFDYYLKGAKMPVWMQKGVPAIEKGINQGYELISE